jgi:hypothetical protein
MKQLFLILFFAGWGCNAQSPILPIQGSGTRSKVGAYYKDVDNLFSKFEGSWKYTNGNESFTITLQKKTSYYEPEDQNYIDIIIGEYKYIDNNGVTTVNTLPNLTISDLTPYQNNIAGMVIMDRSLPINSRRLQLTFTDPERSYLNQSIRIRYIPAQGDSPEKIELTWIGDSSAVSDDTSPTTIRVPKINYTLIKQ